MSRLLRSNLYFLLPYLLFAVLGGIILLSYTKREIHLAVNGHYSSAGDIIFYGFTQLGDGLVAALVGIVVLWRWRRQGLALAGAMLGGMAIAQVLKHVFFSHEPRPKLYFESISEKIRLVPDFNNYIYDSFPSGHTTQAFALCCSIAFMLPQRYNWAKFLLFCTALSIGYSRMYLSQHFFRDVYFGALIGTSMAILFFTLFLRKNWLKQDDSLNLTA